MFNYRQNNDYYPRQMNVPFDFNRRPQEVMKYSNYFFRPNDTLDKIALKYFTTPYELIVSNDIDPRNIYPGLVIQVPLLQLPDEFKWYEVQENDSLWTILEDQGFEQDELPKLVTEIAAVNEILPGDLIYPTEHILIPRKKEKLIKEYVVKDGDTLDSISILQNIGIDDILFNNKNLFLKPGQTLVLPQTETA